MKHERIQSLCNEKQSLTELTVICATGGQEVHLAHQAHGLILIHHDQSGKAETFTDTQTAIYFLNAFSVPNYNSRSFTPTN